MSLDPDSSGLRGVKSGASIGTLMCLIASPILALLALSYVYRSHGQEPPFIVTELSKFFGSPGDYQSSRAALLMIVGFSSLTVIFKLFLYIVKWLD